MRAAALPAAVGAVQHRRIAAAVEEHQTLLAACDAGADRLDQRRRQRRAGAAVLRLLIHVDQAHARQQRAADARGQRQAQVAALVGALPAFQRRRGRAQQHLRALQPRAVDGQVACRVARPFLLLVRRVVLLVDHDQPEPRHRREDRQPRAQHQIGQAQMCRQPAAQSLRRCHAAVQRDDAPAGEARREAGLELRRQVDLGHQHQRLPAGLEGAGRGVQVDLGLAASGHAVQQHRRGIGDGVQLRQHLGLLRARRRRLVGMGLGRLRHRLVQLAQAQRDLAAVELVQFRRQHRQGQFAEAALVVTRCKTDQLAPGGVHRRQFVEHARQRLEGVVRELTRAIAPHDPEQVAAAQRCPHQCSGRERTLTQIVEHITEAGMLRRLDRDLQSCPVRHATAIVSLSRHCSSRREGVPPSR